MQEEHQQLIEEMESLRQRADQLSRMRDLQIQSSATESRSITKMESVESTSTKTSQTRSVASSSSSISSSQTVAIAETSNAKQIESNVSSASSVTGSDNDPIAQLESALTQIDDQEGDEDADPEYIRQKIAEIASLKAQFKRVQHMMDTTSMIEKHIESKSVSSQSTASMSSVSKQQAKTVSSLEQSAESVMSSEVGSNMAVRSAEMSAVSESSSEEIHAENQELLANMLGVFNDFTSDMRNQAEGLRAERERIRMLKEEIIRNKQNKS